MPKKTKWERDHDRFGQVMLTLMAISAVLFVILFARDLINRFW
jgi:hypothetical protein